MANELLPCPFCGGPAEIYNPFHMIGKPSQPATYRGGVRCRACGCESKATTPPDGAITTWNRRADATPQASAENVRELPDAEMRTLIGNYFADDWAKEAAAGLLHDYARALKQPQADKDGGQQRAGDAIRDLIAKHAELLESSDYVYFELARTRQTGWMAWLCSHPVETNPDRKVLARGQGVTPDEACRAAMADFDARAALSAPQTEQGERDE